jgi:hypothetical protein
MAFTYYIHSRAMSVSMKKGVLSGQGNRQRSGPLALPEPVPCSTRVGALNDPVTKPRDAPIPRGPVGGIETK